MRPLTFFAAVLLLGLWLGSAAVRAQSGTGAEQGKAEIVVVYWSSVD